MAASTPKPTPASHPPTLTRAVVPSAEQNQAKARLDFILVTMVLVLSFLLGSFAVRNSDFWMHLATGREIAQGHYQFGKDPFSYTSGDTTWVNHSWLYDLLVYLGYSALGDTPLVVLKALGIAAFAVVLLQIRRPDQSLWIPAASTGLAMLTLSPKVQFQPTLVSYLFLALTLLILTRARNTRWLWALVPLFILWVNLDAWFLLGPVTAGLFLLGEVLDNALKPAPSQTSLAAPSVRPLLIVAAAATAACLVNPHHVLAFTTLPVEVSFANYAELLRTMPGSPVPWMFYSAWQPQYWSPNFGLNVAGVAFVPLMIAGLVAFGVNYKNLNWPRLLVWLALVGLGLWRAQCLGFFAVVAGPITALNFQDFAARRSPQSAARPMLDWTATLKGLGLTLAVLTVFAVIAKTSLVSSLIDLLVKTTMGVENVSRALGLPNPSVQFLVFAVVTLGLFLYAIGPLLSYLSDVVVSWSVGGRLLSVVLALVLLVMVWPGWLQIGGFSSDPQVPRRVAWTIEPDQSMKKVAETITAWRGQGLLPPEAHGFHTLPQVGNYLAWFSPGEKDFYDYRYALFADVTEPYLEYRRLLTSDHLIALVGAAGLNLPDGVTGSEVEQSLNRLENLCRDQNIRYVVLTGLEANSALVAVRNMLILETKRPAWKPLYMDGRSVILSWHDPASGTSDSLKPVYYDPDQEAFKPQHAEPPAPVRAASASVFGRSHALHEPTPAAAAGDR